MNEKLIYSEPVKLSNGLWKCVVTREEDGWVVEVKQTTTRRAMRLWLKERQQ